MKKTTTIRQIQAQDGDVLIIQVDNTEADALPIYQAFAKAFELVGRKVQVIVTDSHLDMKLLNPEEQKIMRKALGCTCTEKSE